MIASRSPAVSISDRLRSRSGCTSTPGGRSTGSVSIRPGSFVPPCTQRMPVRDGNTGIAISDVSPAARNKQYLASESSDTSHSRCRVNRKKISSTSYSRHVRSSPSAWTRPYTNGSSPGPPERALRRDNCTAAQHRKWPLPRPPLLPAADEINRRRVNDVRVRGAQEVSAALHDTQLRVGAINEKLDLFLRVRDGVHRIHSALQP